MGNKINPTKPAQNNNRKVKSLNPTVKTISPISYYDVQGNTA